MRCNALLEVARSLQSEVNTCLAEFVILARLRILQSQGTTLEDLCPLIRFDSQPEGLVMHPLTNVSQGNACSLIPFLFSDPTAECPTLRWPDPSKVLMIQCIFVL